MRRGTRVANAYVAISADGSSINDDIADSLEDVDFKGLGDKHGKDYSKALESRMRDVRKNFWKTMGRDVRKAVETDREIDSFIKRTLTGSDRMRWMNPFMREVANKAGVEFSDEWVDVVKAVTHKRMRGVLSDAIRGGDTDLARIVRQFDSGVIDSEGENILLATIGPEMEKAAAEVKKVRDRMNADARKAEAAYTKFLETEENKRAAAQLDRVAAERLMAKEHSERVKKRMADIEAAFEAEETRLRTLDRAYEEHAKWQRNRMSLLKQAHDMNRKFNSELANDQTFVRATERARKIMEGIRFTPKVDERDIRKFEADLRNKIHKRDMLKYELDVNADLKPGQRIKLKEQIESIDAEIKVKADTRQVERKLLDLARKRGRVEQLVDGQRIGRMFGAGSRNNFLNLLGRTIGNLVSTVPKVTGAFTGMFRTFSEGWNAASEGAGMLQKAMLGLRAVGARVGVSLVAGLKAAAVAIPVILGLFSALISSVGALLGIATALASTIVSGLTAGLMVLAPLLASAAAAAGLLVVAFTSLTDIQKAGLADMFRPVREILAGLGAIMLDQIIPSMHIWSENLQRALTMIAPMAERVGKAFADIGTILTNMLSSEGFQKFYNVMARDLPAISVNMSQAFSNFFNGLMAVFAALMPYVVQFSQYLSDVSERFQKWANSSEGQNSIVEFTGRAVESLKALWGFVREFIGWVRDVLFNPDVQQFGNDMFQSLARSFRRLRDNIEDGSLEEWIKDARKFGEQLWSVLTAIWDVITGLYESGTIEALAMGLEWFGKVIGWVDTLVSDSVEVFKVFAAVLTNPVDAAVMAATGKLEAFGEIIEKWANRVISVINTIRELNPLYGARIPKLDPINIDWSFNLAQAGLSTNAADEATGAVGMIVRNSPSRQALIDRGKDVIRNRNVGDDPPEKPDWVNPFKAWAESLIDDGPSISESISEAMKDTKKRVREAIKEINKSIRDALKEENSAASAAIREAATASGADSVISSLRGVIDSMESTSKSVAESILSTAKSTADSIKSSAQSTVDSARSALNSAAQTLASASNPEDANRALAAVRRAQADLAAAETAQGRLDRRAEKMIERAERKANKAQRRMDKANRILERQAWSTQDSVRDLVRGLRVQSATLADYAAARERVAEMLADANRDLEAQIGLRDSFRDQIASSIKAFGALTSAQGQVIDGLQQSLTASDITSNLEDRLQQIREFQDNTRKLLAQGLSQDAYRQILEAGVEGGSAYAEALVAGGQGAVLQTNALVKEINSVADSLGLESSSILYQAGVDAAQGLVDGLTSLSKELDAAAYKLGSTIASAVKKALGIQSPSTVMFDAMDDVGTGLTTGLDAQQARVRQSAKDLFSFIAVSPEVATYAARQGTSATMVSGNQRPIELTVVTPTKDPHAVAMETLNELTGRLD